MLGSRAALMYWRSDGVASDDQKADKWLLAAFIAALVVCALIATFLKPGGVVIRDPA